MTAAPDGAMRQKLGLIAAIVEKVPGAFAMRELSCYNRR